MEILEVEVEFLTYEVEEIEDDVNQLDDEMTVMEETVIGNTNDISGVFYGAIRCHEKAVNCKASRRFTTISFVMENLLSVVS